MSDETTTPPLEGDKSEKEAKKQQQKEEDKLERLKAKNWDLQRQIDILQKQNENLKAEKRKPGIPVIEEDGEQSKRRRPDSNPWGLTTLMLPPLMKNRTAIYRLTGLDAINPATEQPVIPFHGQIPGRYTLYDKFEKDPMKRDKVVTNIVGTERYVEDGKAKTRDKIDDVEFDFGMLHVNIEKKYLFHVFLELHPLNKTNPHRPHGYGAAFERIDINYRSKPFGDAKFDLGIDAANEVDKLKPDEVLAYAAAIKAIDTSSAKRPIGEIKRELKQYAFHNPQDFYRLNKNSKEAVRLNMVEAHQYGLISYDVNTRHWVFTETEEKICTHTASQDPNQELVKFLSSDEGAEWYEVIMSRLNWWDPKQ